MIKVGTCWQVPEESGVTAEMDVQGGGKDQGLTLIEIVIAVTLLLIVLVPGAVLLVETAKSSTGLAMRATANSLASGDLACVDSQPLQTLASEANECVGSNAYVPAEAGTFRVVQVVGKGMIGFLVRQATKWVPVEEGSNTFECLQVKVSVYWPFVSPLPQQYTQPDAENELASWMKDHPNAGKLTRSATGRCEYVPQIEFSPPSIDFLNWSSGQYLDASPGNTSPVVDVTLTVAPPSIPTELYDWVDIGDVVLSGSGAGDFSLASDSCQGKVIYSAVTSASTSATQPEPTSCTVGVQFSPPTSASPGSSVDASIQFFDNAASSPQTVQVEGYVSPDLYVVK